MGESGVGKSTLLKLIAGLDIPDAGRVELDGIDLASMEAIRAPRFVASGSVRFPAFHILPHLILEQNVGLPLALLRAAPAEVRRRATELMVSVGLAGSEADYPSQLSGGELQRVAIVRALAHRPALILADEPTGNLDPETATMALALLVSQLRQAGAGGLLVTHSNVAAASADRVMRLTATGLVPA